MMFLPFLTVALALAIRRRRTAAVAAWAVSVALLPLLQMHATDLLPLASPSRSMSRSASAR
jgi:hypothetical protein